MRGPLERLGLSHGTRVALDWILTIAGAVAIVFAMKLWVVNPYRIPSSSMEPTLHCARPGSGCLAHFSDRVRRLGDRLGPVRVSVKSARDEGLVELLLGSLDPSLRLAFDLEHPSWDGIEPRLAEAGAVRVNDLEADASFRYVRLREPPYSDDDLARWAERLRGAAVPTFVYLRHEDEPTAPRYATWLIELLG